MSIATIKTAIKTNLDELVTVVVLSGATITDIKTDPLNADIGTYPHAFLMPPSVSSEINDNRHLVRTYTFDIMILFKAENLQSTTQLETAIEAVLSKFDNDPTLGGTAIGGILPVSSTPEPFQHQQKQLIMVVVQIEAKELVPLTFS